MSGAARARAPGRAHMSMHTVMRGNLACAVGGTWGGRAPSLVEAARGRSVAGRVSVHAVGELACMSGAARARTGPCHMASARRSLACAWHSSVLAPAPFSWNACTRLGLDVPECQLTPSPAMLPRIITGYLQVPMRQQRKVHAQIAGKAVRARDACCATQAWPGTIMLVNLAICPGNRSCID